MTRKQLSAKALIQSMKAEHESDIDVSELSFQDSFRGGNNDSFIDIGDDDPRVQEILVNSFLEPYLRDYDYTDMSYNGTQFRVQHNLKGRFMPENQPSKSDVERLIKNIKDNRQTEFSDSVPVLDTEIGFLRVNAMHESISPDGITMALRISRPRLAITDLDDLARGDGELLDNLFSVLIQAEQNLLVSGRTGTGKTEFQKKLVGYTTNDSKITLIEDTRDSHLKAIYPDKDINSWKTNSRFSMSDGVVAALRNNPDWVIIAETRGEVSADVLNSAKTDHAIITTLHASSALGIVARLIPMIRQTTEYARMDDMLLGSEIAEFLRFGIQLKAERIQGRMVRYIREIVEFTGHTKTGTKGNTLYRYTNRYDPETKTYTPIQQYGQMSEKTVEELEERRLIHLLPDIFNPRVQQKQQPPNVVTPNKQ